MYRLEEKLSLEQQCGWHREMTEKKKVLLIVSGGFKKGISARTEERSENVRMLKRPTNLDDEIILHYLRTNLRSSHKSLSCLGDGFLYLSL